MSKSVWNSWFVAYAKKQRSEAARESKKLGRVKPKKKLTPEERSASAKRGWEKRAKIDAANGPKPLSNGRFVSSTVRAYLVRSNPDIHSTPFDCDICRKRITFSAMRVDHCHRTGQVRGYLCNSCNVGIGLFLDSTKLMEAAIEYLKRNEAVEVKEDAA